MTKLEQLKSLMGRRFKRQEDSKEFTFLAYKAQKKSEQFTIVTDDPDEWLEITIFDLDIFLSQFDELESPSKLVVSKKKEQAMIIPQTKSVSNDKLQALSKTLFDTLEKVKGDRDYIAQANQVSNICSQIINLAKLEIEIRTKLSCL